MTEPRPWHVSRLTLAGITALGVVAAVAMLAAVFALAGDTDVSLPPGYFGDVARLSEDAAANLVALAPAAVLAACLNGDADSCAQHQANVRAAAGRSNTLQRAFMALTPPERATAWHSHYRDALIQLTGALFAQAEALDARDATAFASAVERTRSAAEREGALTAEFNRDFGAELTGNR